MASLRLGRYELDEYELPPVCAKCGQKAVATPHRRFAWSPQWLPVFILLGVPGLLLWFILGLALTKRMTVPLPLCEQHRNYWRNRGLMLYGGFITWVLLTVLVIVVAVHLHEEYSGDSDVLVGVLASVGLFVTFLVFAVVVTTTSIRSREITDRSITLIGLSDEFVDEVREDRRGDPRDDEDDRSRRRDRRDDDKDRDRGRGRRARAEEDDSGYYDPRKEGRRGRDKDDDDRRSDER